jgi:hypothetical protein
MPKGVYLRGQNSKWSNCRGDPVKHFWDRVNKDGPIHLICGQCWVWIGALIRGGYGQFRGERSHRFAYRNLVGEIPDGILVLHRCDNPVCVNPAHLFLGTPQTNMDDKVSKGRQKGGTKTPCYGARNGRFRHGRHCR